MERLQITDEFLQKNMEIGIEHTMKEIISKHLHHQVDRYKRTEKSEEEPYTPEQLFSVLEDDGFDVKGTSTHFTVYFGKVRLIFNKSYCQFEGLKEYYYPNVKISDCTQKGILQLLKDMPAIIDMVNEDIARAEEILPILKLDSRKRDIEVAISYKFAKTYLENYFNKRGYKYSISPINGKKLHIQANLANGRKMVFDIDCCSFLEDYQKILAYITTLTDIIRREPFKIRIK